MSTESPASPSAQTINMLRLIGFAVAGGVIFFMIVSIVLNQQQGPLMPEWINYHSTLLAGNLVFGIGCLVTAKKILQKGVANAKDSLNDTPGKLNMYRTTFIVYLVVMEMPALLAVVFYLTTGGFPYLAIAGVILGLMLASLPTKEKISSQLGIDLA